MCGIVGTIRLNEPVDEHAFSMLRDRLSHRGPDGKGNWFDSSGRVALGHRRLAILDLTPTGQQPMKSRCGRYVIVFNGEIYNFVELRAELEKEGCEFLGSGDTEVILAAYTTWGKSCLSRFNGMFAFAIYDQGTANEPKKLFLARDRVGKKPLYYRHDTKGFDFASELKALDTSAGMDMLALNYYLALGYVPAGLCIAKGIAKLPPAHAAEYFPDSGEFSMWRYWALPAYAPDSNFDAEALVEETAELLHDAIRLRLRSDVPVGVLLSGGLDSSLVTACAAHASATPINTFTIAFPGTRYDESSYANIVARHFSTEHHVLELPSPSLSALDDFAALIDEPLADSSIIPSFLVSRLTRQHVKVALGGDGGDELFGGYSNYKLAMQDAGKLGWLPSPVFKTAAFLARELPAGVRGRNRIAALRGGPFQSLVWGSPYFDVGLRHRILDQGTVDALGANIEAPEYWKLGLFNTGADAVDSMTRTDFESVLPDDFMVKVDRTSMAVGLETRAPFLDFRLAELAFSRIPSALKVNGHQTRILQKRLAKRLLPAELDVERKQGFSIPLNEWLRDSNGAELENVRDSLPACIDQNEVSKLLAGHRKGRANGGRLFAMLMLALSCKNLGWSR